MLNPTADPSSTLGKVLAATYGIAPSPYDSPEQLWAKVAKSLGVPVSPYDDVETILEKIWSAIVG